ncbi:hypothetical protein OHA98_02680 [Streptomyces sp. NBC_00654]|uniref:hypothetical protein n=1 Tax=Streptomyces sp. NBC_00654 TaxID=2975799 RepID=UPI002254CE20|nr:hypothetical protein [Streptomyces sp. NBC_00654]MCX4963740.1 hypothetical protein [Streptomyces sp. NBC_00654]
MAAWPDFYPCTCIAVDAQGYGSNNDRRQSEIQHDLPRLLDRAARRAGLDRAQWQIQHKGDEQLAVRPVDGQEPRLVDDYVRHLAAELRAFNAQRVPEAQLRLRAVIHQGLVELADNGFAGTAVVATARLLNADPLYDALAAHPEADLVLLLSDEVFRSVVAGRHTTLLPEDFTRVAVRVKEYEATAWLRVPALGASAASSRRPGTTETGKSVDPASGEPAAVRPEPAAAGSSGGTGISHAYRADNINVTHVAGSVDARGAVFGFGSSGG